jgi:hypothetical protein
MSPVIVALKALPPGNHISIRGNSHGYIELTNNLVHLVDDVSSTSAHRTWATNMR